MGFAFSRVGGWQNPGYDCIKCKQHHQYQTRNCKKYFPDQPHNPNYKWYPEGRTNNGVYIVPDVSCTDCPVSYITPESLELIQLDNRQRHAKEATGASLYGNDISRWPSKLLDALVTIEHSRIACENARIESTYSTWDQ